MVLLSAQRMPAAKIAEVTFTSADRVRDVIHNFNADGFDSLHPKPGRQWAERGGKGRDPDRGPRARRRATYTRPHGVRHLFAAYDLAKDQVYGHIKQTKNRSEFPEFCRCLRSLHPGNVRIAITV